MKLNEWMNVRNNLNEVKQRIDDDFAVNAPLTDRRKNGYHSRNGIAMRFFR